MSLPLHGDKLPASNESGDSEPHAQSSTDTLEKSRAREAELQAKMKAMITDAESVRVVTDRKISSLRAHCEVLRSELAAFQKLCLELQEADTTKDGKKVSKSRTSSVKVTRRKRTDVNAM